MRYIAHLARLYLSEGEEKKFACQLQEILEWVNKLEKLDTTGVPFTSHVVPLSNVFRKDELTKSLSEKDALLNAPRKGMSHFQVPKVIGN